MPGIQADRTFCLTYEAREAYSLDFLLCEGYNGWAATHMMSFFTLMLFIGNIAPTWIAAALLETFEALIITTFGAHWLMAHGYTSALSLETLAGSIIGDWMINDLFGILAAWFLLRTLDVPGLLSPWFQSSHRQALDLPPIWKSTLWWKQAGVAILLMAMFILPVWVYPTGCDQHIPYDCWNVGLIANAIITLIIIAVCAGWFMRSDDHQRHFWRGHRVSARRRNAFFFFWAFYVLLVSFQNIHPAVLWFVPLIAEWAQCWLAGLVWVIILACYARFSKKDDRE